jgi:hypothetical protein
MARLWRTALGGVLLLCGCARATSVSPVTPLKPIDVDTPAPTTRSFIVQGDAGVELSRWLAGEDPRPRGR